MLQRQWVLEGRAADGVRRAALASRVRRVWASIFGEVGRWDWKVGRAGGLSAVDGWNLNSGCRWRLHGVCLLVGRARGAVSVRTTQSKAVERIERCFRERMGQWDWDSRWRSGSDGVSWTLMNALVA